MRWVSLPPNVASSLGKDRCSDPHGRCEIQKRSPVEAGKETDATGESKRMQICRE